MLLSLTWFSLNTKLKKKIEAYLLCIHIVKKSFSLNSDDLTTRLLLKKDNLINKLNQMISIPLLYIIVEDRIDCVYKSSLNWVIIYNHEDWTGISIFCLVIMHTHFVFAILNERIKLLSNWP